MPPIRFLPLPAESVAAIRAGAPDANGRAAERAVSDGAAPCRCCLRDIPAGAPMLVLAWRPFGTVQPYAETGPVFLCADTCAPWDGAGLPPVLTSRARHMIRGYDAGERIVEGTGAVEPTDGLPAAIAARLADPAVAAVHIRSAVNGCYTCKAARG
jgi:hypothetical protein